MSFTGAGRALATAAPALTSAAETLAQIYHHVCAVNGTQPERLLLEHAGQPHGKRRPFWQPRPSRQPRPGGPRLTCLCCSAGLGGACRGGRGAGAGGGRIGGVARGGRRGALGRHALGPAHAPARRPGHGARLAQQASTRSVIANTTLPPSPSHLRTFPIFLIRR